MQKFALSNHARNLQHEHQTEQQRQQPQRHDPRQQSIDHMLTSFATPAEMSGSQSGSFRRFLTTVTPTPLQTASRASKLSPSCLSPILLLEEEPCTPTQPSSAQAVSSHRRTSLAACTESSIWDEFPDLTYEDIAKLDAPMSDSGRTFGTIVTIGDIHDVFLSHKDLITLTKMAEASQSSKRKRTLGC